MTEEVLRLIATHGPALVFVVVLLSATGFPLPGSLSLLAAGSFVASGEMSFAAVALAALVGTMTGDQIGYVIGARGGQGALDWAARHGMGPAVQRAGALTGRWGDWGNFLSRWLICPVAPAMNLVSGMLGVPWGRFFLICLVGEMLWVVLYVGMGMIFSRQVSRIAEASGDLALFLIGSLVAVLLVARLRRHPIGPH